MNRRKLYSIVALGAVLSLVVLSPQAQAQRGGGGGGFGGGMMMGGPGGFRMIEPTVSNASQLLQRPDVQTELMLTGRQREQLDAARQEMMSGMGTKVRANMPDFSKLQGLSPEERKVEQEKMRQQMQDGVQSAMTSATDDLDKKLATILDAGQMKRLHELDLQWRGPLAIATPKIGDKLPLTDEQKPKVQAVLEEYKKGRNEAVAAAFSGMQGVGGAARGNRGNRGTRGGVGATGNGAATQTDPNVPTPPATPGTPPQIDMADIQKRMADSQVEADKIRAKLGEKMLTLLTTEQLASWKTMTGKKFLFRKSE